MRPTGVGVVRFWGAAVRCSSQSADDIEEHPALADAASVGSGD
jgi:hypothetical protein